MSQEFCQNPLVFLRMFALQNEINPLGNFWGTEGPSYVLRSEVGRHAASHVKTPICFTGATWSP